MKVILRRNIYASFFDIFYADRLLKLKTRDYLLMLDVVIPNTCKK